MRNDATVNAADIARLADVGRAAVSNWRKRYDDFPQPVGGTASSPTFSLVQVEEWLRRQGKKFNVSTGDRIWQRLRTTDDDLRLGDLVGTVGAFLLFVKRQPAEWKKLAKQAELLERLPDAMAKAVPDVPGPLTVLDDIELVHSLVDYAKEVGEAKAFDFICGRYVEAHSRRLLATPDEIAELIVSLVDGPTVLDPACGIGTLLVAAKAERLLGQEINATAARLTAVRLLLHERNAVISTGDSLRRDAFAGEHADAVICNPPFADRTWGYEELSSDPRWEYGLPPRGESELAWVQHCLAHVKPGGHVVIVMPSAAAGRRSGRRIRSNLLRSGVLRAVVTLPAGAAPASSMAPALWLLRRPLAEERPPSHVLMVNAANDLSIVQPAWQAFCRDPDGEPPLPDGSGALRIIDLLDDEVDVSTGRHLATAATVSAEGFNHTRQQLVSASAALSSAIPDLPGESSPCDLPLTTVGDLVKAGVITMLHAPLKMALNEGEMSVLTARDVAMGRSPSGRTHQESGTVICQANDVVTPVLTHQSVARVIKVSGAVLGPQISLFRVDPDRLDPYFLAGFLRAAGASGVARASSASSRIDPRRAPIPLLPLPEQQAYGIAFRRLMELESAAQQVAQLSESLVQLGFNGIIDGTLRPHA
ncbi:N-6 DNA methylase [Microbispora amethystogenes]|uniref:SAM-dependent methyltransferase n=1 Tax=Microbispora amethystogenes TaxID=1427754 RepID=A0ABQ4FNE1_9ACTN|nr:N-6 DNA methylase [Microbispora amethystogenes]GIH36273.1 SAM-dependent methyltransferase [Microbispora amethystogenes]